MLQSFPTQCTQRGMRVDAALEAPWRSDREQWRQALRTLQALRRTTP